MSSITDTRYLSNLPQGDGYVSRIMRFSEASQFSITYLCPQITTIKLYGMNTEDITKAILLFQEEVAPDIKFFKRFPIKSNYAYYTITSTDAVPALGYGVLQLYSNNVLTPQFESSTYLNSLVPDNDNCQLIRVANNFQNDLVRGMHTKFKKVNIQGIYTNTIYSGYPTAEETVGNNQNFTAYANTGSTALHINATSVNDTTGGTGATTSLLKYIDSDGEEAEVAINVGTGAIGISGRSVISHTIMSVGALGHNDGTITIENAGGTIIYNTIYPQQNISHTAIYQVPTGKELVVRNMNITGQFPDGEIVVLITDTNNISGVFGRFLIGTQQVQLNYDLDTLLTAGQMIRVNIIPSGTTTTSPALINININAMLSSTINLY